MTDTPPNTAVERFEVQGPPSTNIISVIERAALDPNVDIDKMERLLAMQERIMEREAGIEFAAAFSEMQAELPEIPKLGEGHNSNYAKWEDINEIIRPILAKYGFSISFTNGIDDGKQAVTCILLHRAGHSKQTTLALPTDLSGNKTNVHGIASSVSYGKRYAASALLNLVSRGEDDDGEAAGKVRTRWSAEKGKRYLNFDLMCEDISKAEGRRLDNIEAFYRDECEWFPSGWQKQLLDLIKERDAEIEHADDEKTKAAVSANESLDRQFKDTIG